MRRTERHGKGWKYKRAVPRPLRSVLNKTYFIRWLNKRYSAADAERAEAAFDLETDAIIARLMKIDPAERAKIATQGGFDHLRKLQASRGGLINLIEVASSLPTDDADADELYTFKAQKEIIRLRDEIAARAVVLGDVKRSDGLYGLIDLAKALDTKLSPKGLQRAEKYLERFIESIGGDRPPAAVTRDHAVTWRDEMSDAGVSLSNQAQHIGKVGALFARALSEGKVSFNPFAGIKTKAKEGVSDGDQVETRPFTPDELRKFMDLVDQGENSDFQLIVRTLMLTGARSSEIAEIDVRDIRHVEGVLCFDINTRSRRLKNKQAPRLVPVPSVLAAQIAARAKGRDGDERLFEMIKAVAKGHAVQNRASKIIRGFSVDAKLSLRGLRKLWRRTAENIGIAGANRRAILGHKIGADVHDNVYGERPSVKKLKPSIDKVAKALDGILK